MRQAAQRPTSTTTLIARTCLHPLRMVIRWVARQRNILKDKENVLRSGNGKGVPKLAQIRVNDHVCICLLNRLPVGLGPSTRDRLIGEQKMYRSLISVLERSESAPSLREVPRRLGVSVGALRYRFPRETK